MVYLVIEQVRDQSHIRMRGAEMNLIRDELVAKRVVDFISCPQLH